MCIRDRDGAEALHKAEECSPQLAILDVMMPRMNGFELTKALRRQSDIPILIPVSYTHLDVYKRQVQ